MSGPDAKKIAFRLGICRGSYPWPPRGGILAPPLEFESCATMGYGPVGTTTGSPSRGFELKCKFAGKRSEEHTSELQSHSDLVCRLLLEKKKNSTNWFMESEQ